MFQTMSFVWSQESNMHSYDPAGQHSINRAYLPAVITEQSQKADFLNCFKDLIINKSTIDVKKM